MFFRNMASSSRHFFQNRRVSDPTQKMARAAKLAPQQQFHSTSSPSAATAATPGQLPDDCAAHQHQPPDSSLGGSVPPLGLHSRIDQPQQEFWRGTSVQDHAPDIVKFTHLAGIGRPSDWLENQRGSPMNFSRFWKKSLFSVWGSQKPEMAKLKLLVHSGSRVLSIYKKLDLKVCQLIIFRHFAAQKSNVQNTTVFNVFQLQSTPVHEPLENWLQSAFWCVLAAGFSSPVKLVFFGRSSPTEVKAPVVDGWACCDCKPGHQN